MTEYKGFYINSSFEIFHNGRQIFTAWWQRCYDLEAAKATIDYSNAANERLRRLPSLDRISEIIEDENGLQAREDNDRWVDGEAEKQLEPKI